MYGLLVGIPVAIALIVFGTVHLLFGPYVIRSYQWTKEFWLFGVLGCVMSVVTTMVIVVNDESSQGRAGGLFLSMALSFLAWVIGLTVFAIRTRSKERAATHR